VSLPEALELHARGFALLPLRSRDKRPHANVLSKIYGTAEWSPLRQRRATEAEVREWAKIDPLLNIGVLTGSVSGGLAVVDIDGPMPTGLRHPPTPTVRTGRGLHLYVRGHVASRKLPFGDLQAEGRYVAAPPSVHASGTPYEWLIRPDESELAALDDVEGLELDPAGRASEIAISDAQGLAETGVAELGHQRAAIEIALPRLGIHAPIGHAFRCVLPGHADDHPSASIDPSSLRYHDWHTRTGGRYYFSLAEVYASQCAGAVVTLKSVSHARWWDRLWHDVGLRPVMVAPPVVPARVTANQRAVADEFALLVALNDRRHPGEPVAFAPRFAAAWCGVSTKVARTAIEQLRHLDVIRRVSRQSKPLEPNLYVLGDGSQSGRYGYPGRQSA
jgi:hypothetical protein